MTDFLSQDRIREITGRVQPRAQEDALRRLGFIVLGRNPAGQVQAIATHPADPALRFQGLEDAVVLELQ